MLSVRRPGDKVEGTHLGERVARMAVRVLGPVGCLRGDCGYGHAPSARGPLHQLRRRSGSACPPVCHASRSCRSGVPTHASAAMVRRDSRARSGGVVPGERGHRVVSALLAERCLPGLVRRPRYCGIRCWNFGLLRLRQVGIDFPSRRDQWSGPSLDDLIATSTQRGEYR